MNKKLKAALALLLVVTLNLPILTYAAEVESSLPGEELRMEAETDLETEEETDLIIEEASTDTETSRLSVTVKETGSLTAAQLLEGYTNTTGIEQANSPTITSIEECTTPVPHLKVMVTIGTLGGFDMHLPPKEKFEGRFYQLVHPTFVDRNVSDHNIAFGCEDGAYTIQTSGSSFVKLGLNVDAAAAFISRTIAKNYYDYDEKIYGYIYGGSGGSMQTVGAMECTNPNLQNIWDGAVPYITASPISLGNFNIRLFARAVLEEKAPLIKDAVSPGGSGDPYAVLNETEQEVLREVTLLGLPLQAWENYEYLLLMNNNKTLADALVDTAAVTTNSYSEKFWTEPGYIGTEESELGDLFRSLRDSGVNPDGLSAIAYHRYIDPGASFHTWDHLKDANGVSLYPQIGGQHSGVGTATMMSGGAVYNGKINMKVIMIQNLMDVDSFPMDGNWYRQRVIEQGLESNYRIWYNQYADHQENKYMHLDHPYPLENLPERLINYVGSLEQALRDLSSWVEDGVEPPQSSTYDVVDSQVILAEDAASRNGIQPVVDLNVNGAKRADITIGSSVNLEASVQVTSGLGMIVSTEWDLYGDGNFVSANFNPGADGSAVVTGTATFTQPGTYYPQVRVVSQRESDVNTPFARVENLGRVRVVVTEAEPETEPETQPNTEKKPVKVEISKATLNKIASQVFTGKAIKPEIKLTYNGATLVKDKDYTVIYRNNTNIGAAKVVITGKGNYQGSVSTSFKIIIKKGKTYSIGNYKYKITNAKTNGKGCVTVTGTKTRSIKTISVKATVKIGGKTFKITSIGKVAFKNCKKATKATIGKNIKTIQANAFLNCKKLKRVTINSMVLNSVGKQALKGIAKNAKIILPKKKTDAYSKLLKKSGYKM